MPMGVAELLKWRPATDNPGLDLAVLQQSCLPERGHVVESVELL